MLCCSTVPSRMATERPAGAVVVLTGADGQIERAMVDYAAAVGRVGVQN